MPRRLPFVRAAAVLVLPLLASSCFTMAVWGFFPEDEYDPFTRETSTAFVYDEQTDWSWRLVFLRVLATPFSLALDCLTCPVQAVLWGSGDDGGTGERHR